MRPFRTFLASVTPHLSSVLITTVLLISLGAAYFMWYIPSQEQRIALRQYRCLQRLETSMQEKVANTLALLQARMRYNQTQPHDTGRVAVLNRYATALQPGENFSFHWNNNAPKADPKKEPSDTLVQVRDDGIAIRLRDHQTLMEIDYTYPQFFGQLFQHDLFDGYVLYHPTRVVYQTFPSGAESVLADSLRLARSTYTLQRIHRLSLSGTDYTLFIHQVTLTPGNTLLVAGLLKSARYDRERRLLPPNAGILLLLTVLGVILSLPWLKQYQLGSRDRITGLDAMACYGVALLLIALLTFVWLEYVRPLKPANQAFDLAAPRMAAQLEHGFERDLAQATCAMRAAAERLFCQECKPPAGQQYPDTLNRLVWQALNGVQVSQLYTLGADGRELRNWLPTGRTAPPGDFSDRAYYRDARQHNLRQIPGAEIFALEPVISRTTGIFTTVICMPAPRHQPYAYLALSCTPAIFKNAVLTPGFRYSIIDDTGRVLYDSDTTRQLNENLFEEFSGQPAFAAGVHARRSDSFPVSYAGSGYKAFIRPMQHLPYTMVIMEDDGFRNMRENNQFVFTFSLTTFFLILLGLQAVLTFFLTGRRLYWHKHFHDMSWLGPRKSGGDRYSLCFQGNVMLTVVVMLSWSNDQLSLFNNVFMLLTAANSSSYFRAFLTVRSCAPGAEKSRARMERNTQLLWLLITLLTAVLTGHGHGALWISLASLLWFALVLCRFVPEKGGHQRPARIARCILLAIVLAFMTAWIALAIWLLLWWAGWPRFLEKSAKAAAAGNRTRGTFTLMVFSRFMLIAALPVFLFFVLSFDYYQALGIRYRQLAFGRELIGKGLRADAPGLADGVWVDSLSDAPAGRVHPHQQEPGLAEKLYIRLFRDNLPDAGLPGMKDYPPDGSWAFSNIFKLGPDTTWIRRPSGVYLQVASVDLQWHPAAFDTGKYWYAPPAHYALLLAVLCLLFTLFHQVLGRLFGPMQAGSRGWATIDAAIVQSPTLNNLLFLIGPPGSGKLNYVKQLIKDNALMADPGQPYEIKDKDGGTANVLLADMILIPNDPNDAAGRAQWQALLQQTQDTRYRLIIINHFEYDIKNPDSNRTKLALLEDLLRRSNAKLLIISTVHPVNFLDSINQQQRNEPDLAQKMTPEHDLERWHVLLGHFRIVIKALTFENGPCADDTGWLSTLHRETASGHYLQALREPIRERRTELEQEGVTGQSISLKVGITAHYFYMYIWQSLTKEEKFLLYDLAEDGLVNGFDDYNLTLLVSKGLIVAEDGRLRLFNFSFREFVLTAIGPSEASAIQQEIRDNGNWSKLKLPLLLMVAALLVFLFASQREGYSELLKYVAVVTGGVPLILQVFTLFRNSANGSSAAAH